MRQYDWRGVIFAYVAINFLLLFYFLFTTPIFGWDVLNLWVPKTIEFFTDYSNAPADTKAYSIRQYRHPPTVMWMQSSAMYVLNGNVILSLLLPVFFFLSVVIFIHERLSLGRRLAVACTSVTISLSSAPLLANHYLIHGYAEIYVGASILLALALWQRGFCADRGRVYFGGAILCAFFPLALKNTGVLYSAAVLVSFSVAAVAFSNCSRRAKVIALAFIAAGSVLLPIFVVWNVNWSATWMGSKFANDVVSRTLWFGGYPLQFSYVGFTTVLRNTIQALFINQSFGVLVFTYLVALLFSVTGSGGPKHRKDRHFMVLATICAVTTWALFTMPQLVSERANAFSAPGMDTGYSRFLIPVAMLLPVPLAAIYRQARVQ